ncbi:MAG TPA: DUF2721 domain-containing protein [Ohtaekwangia sp.]|nr:DUF2721 domain-containing protein [Ohtaekwangia sp.]
MDEVTPSLSVLSSMITPAVLILASGSLIMTTSQRLNRVIERVRKISDEFGQIQKSSDRESASEIKRKILYSLLNKNARRSKLLTRAMTFLYVSLGLFVATSLTIGILSVVHSKYAWVPTAIGLTGSLFLFCGSAVLIIEARLTRRVIADEVDYVIASSKANAPESSRTTGRTWRNRLRF